jgi:hypothetical protein
MNYIPKTSSFFLAQMEKGGKLRKWTGKLGEALKTDKKRLQSIG